MAEWLFRGEQGAADRADFDPLADAATLKLPVQVARDLWRVTITEGGSIERFRELAREAAGEIENTASEPGKRVPGARGVVMPTGEPGKLSASVAVRPFAPPLPIARLATGGLATGSPLALELAARSVGQRLPIELQHRFAYLFDHGFEHVQLHTDAAARAACEALAAHGFTVGAHVFLALDAQQLATPHGGDVLQHELAHVVQHDRGELASVAPRVTEPGDWVEHAAHQLVQATKPRRAELAAKPHGIPRARARRAAAPVAPGVIARDALGRLAGGQLQLDIDQSGVSCHILVPVPPAVAARLQADPAAATRFAQDFARALAPNGRARFESRQFLESSATSSRVAADLPRWLDGQGLVATTQFLDQRAQALANLHLLEPLERALAGRGITPGSIDWAAVRPALLAERPPPAQNLIDASTQDRYYLFLRAIMTEAGARPAVIGATATAAQLTTLLHDYVDHLPTAAFGDAVSIFSEAFLARWSLGVGQLRYTPEGFDVERFRPTDTASALETERHRVLEDFKRTRMPNLIVLHVRDSWSTSRMTEEGFLAHVDIASLRAEIVAHMVDEFMRLATTDAGYRRALRSATQDTARFNAIRALFTLSTAMQRENEGLAVRLVTTPYSEIDSRDLEIAEDPYGYFRSAQGLSQATMSVFSTLQRTGDIGAAFEGLPPTEGAAAFTGVAAMVALFSQLNAIRSLHEQQESATRTDLRHDIELSYPEVVQIVQRMWDAAEAYIRDVYIPKLKEVALRILTANRDELANWHDHWDTQTPQLIATYRIAAFAFEDVARRLDSGEVTSVELRGEVLERADVQKVRDAAITLRGIADRLASPEGANEKRQELAQALEVFDRTAARIRSGEYPPYTWGREVTNIARAELGIGSFPEFTTYGQVLTGAVAAGQNPFLSRAVVGWTFREQLEAEFRQVAVMMGLGLLTVSSILVPGVGGLILTAVDLALNIAVSARGVADARSALDLALLDPHLTLQGISVEQARSAMRHAWIGLGLSILIPVGIAGFMGAMLWRSGRAMRAMRAEFPHLHAAVQANPVAVERLLGIVGSAERLDHLLGLAGDIWRLEKMFLFGGGDAVMIERLLRRVADTAKLVGWMEHAGSAQRMIAILDRTADAAQIDRLATTYGNDFARMEAHLGVLGTDTAAGNRLLALLEHTGGPEGLSTLLPRIGSTAEQTAFFRAIEHNPAQGVALARTMQSAPGLAGRLARHMGRNLLTHVSVEGNALRLHNELTIVPEALARVPDAEMSALLRACENPAANAADVRRFEGGEYRFRFRTRVSAQVNPWVETMLHEIGIAHDAPEAAMFRDMSESDAQQMWDLPQNRGADARIRPQAARWAMGRRPSSIRQFVADFQFYFGEIEHVNVQIMARLEREVQAAVDTAGAGGARVTDRQREVICRSITGRAVAPGNAMNAGGLGTELVNLTGPAARRAARSLAIDEMAAGGGAAGAARADAAAVRTAADLAGNYAAGETRLTGAITEATAVERVRAQAATLNFSDPATAAYHAHVHIRGIPPPDIIAGANEVEVYLNTARQAVLDGAASTPVRRPDGAWSITYARRSGRTIVTITPEGSATIATFMPGR